MADLRFNFGAITVSTLLITTIASADNLSPAAKIDGMVYGLTPGETARDITFSGTSSGFSGTSSGASGSVEVELFYQDTGETAVPWTTLSDAGPAWQGTLSVPKSIDGWLGARYRTTGKPSEVVELTQRFGVGYKVLQLGQSQTTIYLKTDDPKERDESPEAFATYLTNDATGGYGPSQLSFLGADRSAGLGTFIDQMRVYEEKTPILVVDGAVNGTGPDHLLNDADTRRDWQGLQEKIDFIGNDFSAVAMNWVTTGWNSWNYPTASRLEALISGTGNFAEKKTSGHNLDDALREGYAFVLSPGTRHSDRDLAQTHRQVDYAQQAGLEVGPPLSDFRIEPKGGAHQDSSIDERNPNRIFGQRQALGIARAFGLTNFENPYFVGATRYGSDILVETSADNVFSFAPEEISQWFRVNEGGGFTGSGFSSSIFGSAVRLSKDDGSDWAIDTIISFRGNGPTRADFDPLAEEAIMNGVLYAEYKNDILGLGVPIIGSLSNGAWSVNFRTTVVDGGFSLPPIAAIPTPASGALLAGALGAFVAFRRLRQPSANANCSD